MCFCNMTQKKNNQTACSSHYLVLQMKANSKQSGGNWTDWLMMRGCVNAAFTKQEEAFCKIRLIRRAPTKDVPLMRPGVKLALRWHIWNGSPTMRCSSLWVSSLTMGHCVQSSLCWTRGQRLRGSFLSLVSADWTFNTHKSSSKVWWKGAWPALLFWC